MRIAPLVSLTLLFAGCDGCVTIMVESKPIYDTIKQERIFTECVKSVTGNWGVGNFDDDPDLEDVIAQCRMSAVALSMAVEQCGYVFINGWENRKSNWKPCSSAKPGTEEYMKCAVYGCETSE